MGSHNPLYLGVGVNIDSTFLMQHSDMNEEMKIEAMELCVTACEKHGSNNEVSSLNYTFPNFSAWCVHFRMQQK